MALARALSRLLLLAAVLLLAVAGCRHVPEPARPEAGTAQLPPRMKAAQIAAFGHADVVAVNEVPVPAPGPGQVLVEVHASSINPVDTYIREGRRKDRFPLTLPGTLGTDVAGVVAKVGEGVTAFRAGDRVYGRASAVDGGTGAFAEYAVAAVAKLGRMPRTLDFPAAASLPLVGLSALQAVTEYMKVQPGQKVLIHGGGGGIGSVAVQLAKHAGAHVASTASGDELAFVRSLGADEVIDYRTQRFDELLSGYDAAFDTVGGDTYARSYKVLRRGGVLVSMTHPPKSDLPAQHGVTLVDESTRYDPAAFAALTEAVEAGIVAPHVDRTFPLDRIREAFQAKEQGGVRGKIVIVVRP